MSGRTIRPGASLRGSVLASRPVLTTAVVISTMTAAVAGVSGAAAAASPYAQSARNAPASVPWRQVGPGWAIAEYSASSPLLGPPAIKGPTTLYAVSPQGHKYAFYSWPATSTGYPRFAILDWSGDKQRVLLQDNTVPSTGRVPLEQISVVTGKVVSKFSLPAGVHPLGYTRPLGLNVLATRAIGSVQQIVRYDLAGHFQRVVLQGKNLSYAIDSPDGTSVVVGTPFGLDMVSNAGGTPVKLHAPVAVTGCFPDRWWNATTVLAICSAKSGPGWFRLWLFPVAGGKVTALTPQRLGHGPDYGDIGAWSLTSGLYLQAAARACGTEFIAKQWRNGSAHVISVQGTANNNRIITSLGARLLVQATGGCPGSSSLLWFNPATASVQYVLHAPSTIEGVYAVIPYGRPLS